MIKKILSCIGLLVLTSCGTGEVPAAHKGRLFDRTGALALWSGGEGFKGPILGPGTYYTGLYPQLRTLSCAQVTAPTIFQTLTKDGVQFALEMYVSYGANCDDANAIKSILEKIVPEKDNVIESQQLYNTYIKPALNEAVREAVSPVIANDVNSKREEIFQKIKSSFEEVMNKQNPKMVTIYSLNLSNMDFPDAMDKANTERAVTAIYKDKAIADRERVTAEIETTKMRKVLAESEAANEVAKIDAIGSALKRNPEYLQFDLQQKMPGIYSAAGNKGNLIIAAPNVVIQNQKTPNTPNSSHTPTPSTSK